MADHRICFTLGSYIWFGSLDFLCTGVDHDLILLPPSMLVHPASPPGSDERVGDLDPAGTEGEYVPPTPTKSSDSPADIDSVTKLIAGLRLHANEAHASVDTQPYNFNYSRLVS
jgi:hypothetical protein